MNKAPLLTAIAPTLLVTSHALAKGDDAEGALECRKSSTFFLAPNATGELKYAPDRNVQVQHLALDLTPDFKARTISGSVSLRLRAGLDPVREVKLDAVDLNIQNVSATRKIQAWQSTEDKVVVTFEEAIPADKETTLTITYSAEPKRGIYFRTHEMGYKPGDDHLFSQGEAIEARHWYPCIDSPNQMFTSEVTCHVPQGMTAISNGRLVSETRDPAGLVAIHWSQEKRHANYLITLTAGYFKKLEDNCHGIPLAFYTPPSEIEFASTSFHKTREMVEFFEKETGVPYPWAKYDQVCVNDFVEGGMENTSATTLTDHTLFTEESENIQESDGLISHELAHQWFGDLVTCKDWSHIWLNEGFATFYESLWTEHHHGRDSMVYELYHRAREITGIANENNPIVRRTYSNPDEMFNYLAYPKGSWVLHMLRSQLGPELYRKCIRTYLERHQHGNVVTDDLRAVIEELSGRSFDQFFDQWVYHARQPELDISYAWDEPAKLARISVQQNQEVNANVLLFKFALPIRFNGKFGTENRSIEVSRKQEDFYFPLASAPELVRVDPDYTLLAKTRFNVPPQMLDAQLDDNSDVMGRLLAVEQLGSRQDKESIGKLKKVLGSDSFYGVRVEAARALRSIHTEDALAALLGSCSQTDARVRRTVIENLGGFYDPKACDSGFKVVREEKNPDIVTTALRDLGGYARPELNEVLLKSLKSDSFRNRVADSAIAAMRLQDDTAYIQPLLETLRTREEAFTSYGFSQGLDTLAYLDRHEDKKEAVRQFLMQQLANPKRTVQIGAINALGTLGDPKAIAALEKFAQATADSPQRGAAQRAVASLRADRKPVDDFKNLRQEVLDLQKANRDLRKEMDDLKKRIQTGGPGASQAPGNAKPRKPVVPQTTPKGSSA